ncbi:hypothetical protein LQZ21_09820 [Treponema sp. TIM-1]|uniref:hypothetical protein n=1 Tax=Treponema sp. TIM-1 TaxID=2898417 RepID=UPI003980A58F
MTAVKAYYDGKAFVPISPVHAARNQAAIVTVLDETVEETGNRDYLQFAGSLSDEDYREITAILNSTETIDENEW